MKLYFLFITLVIFSESPLFSANAGRRLSVCEKKDMCMLAAPVRTATSGDSGDDDDDWEKLENPSPKSVLQQASQRNASATHWLPHITAAKDEVGLQNAILTIPSDILIKELAKLLETGHDVLNTMLGQRCLTAFNAKTVPVFVAQYKQEHKATSPEEPAALYRKLLEKEQEFLRRIKPTSPTH